MNGRCAIFIAVHISTLWKPLLSQSFSSLFHSSSRLSLPSNQSHVSVDIVGGLLGNSTLENRIDEGAPCISGAEQNVNN